MLYKDGSLGLYLINCPYIGGAKCCIEVVSLGFLFVSKKRILLFQAKKK